MSTSALIPYFRTHECESERWSECHQCIAYNGTLRAAKDDSGLVEHKGVACAERTHGHVSVLSWQRQRKEAERLYDILVRGFENRQEVWSPRSGGPTVLLHTLSLDVDNSRTQHRSRGLRIRCLITHVDCNGRYLDRDRWLSPWIEVAAPWELKHMDEIHVLRNMLARILNESV